MGAGGGPEWAHLCSLWETSPKWSRRTGELPSGLCPPAHASRGKVVITLSMSHMGTRRLGAVWGWLTMGCLGRLVAACLVSPLSRKLSRV